MPENYVLECHLCSILSETKEHRLLAHAGCGRQFLQNRPFPLYHLFPIHSNLPHQSKQWQLSEHAIEPGFQSELKESAMSCWSKERRELLLGESPRTTVDQVVGRLWTKLQVFLSLLRNNISRFVKDRNLYFLYFHLTSIYIMCGKCDKSRQLLQHFFPFNKELLSLLPYIKNHKYYICSKLYLLSGSTVAE